MIKHNIILVECNPLYQILFEIKNNFLFEMKKNKTYQNDFKQMFEKGKDIKDLALIIDRVNQIQIDDFINRAVVLDTFEIDMASVLAGVQQIVMRRIFDELPCDQTNSVRVRVSFKIIIDLVIVVVKVSLFSILNLDVVC